MTNGEKYAGETHNHYVYERMCPENHNEFWIVQMYHSLKDMLKG